MYQETASKDNPVSEESGLRAMRLTAAVLAWSIAGYAFAGEEGDFCAIPLLVPGVPEVVHLPNIDKEFCGMARINRQYVRLDDVTSRKEVGSTECSSDGACRKTVRYYPKANDSSPPFIIIFAGPKPPLTEKISYFENT